MAASCLWMELITDCYPEKGINRASGRGFSLWGVGCGVALALF